MMAKLWKPTAQQRRDVAAAFSLMTESERHRIGTVGWRTEMAARFGGPTHKFHQIVGEFERLWRELRDEVL